MKKAVDSEGWFLCDCSGEALRIEKYELFENEYEYWFAIYRNGNWNMNIWSRIKYAWRVIFMGEAYKDQITFSLDEFEKLKKFINNL